MPDNLQSQTMPLSVEKANARSHQDTSLLRRMDSKQALVREQAICECRALSSQHIVSLTSLLETKAEQNPAASPLHDLMSNRPLVWVFLAALPLIGVSMIWKLHFAGAIIAAFLLSLFCCIAAATTSVKSYSSRASESLASVIGQIQEPDFLPIAMHFLCTKFMTLKVEDSRQRTFRYQYGGDMPAAFSRAAAHLLRTLDIETIRTFNIQERAFYWFLMPACWRYNPLTTMRVLEILQAVGTPSAIPAVKAIAHERVRPRSLYATRQAAQACLAVLEQRERESRLPQTLLRGAAAPAVLIESLLRPATHNSDDPAHLLRAAPSAKANINSDGDASSSFEPTARTA